MNTSKTEKMAINVGVMELAQIDLLVESMQYNNRSDFVRFAIKNLLDHHKEDLETYYEQSKDIHFEKGSTVQGGIGIFRLSKQDILEAKKANKTIKVMVLGILMIDSDIPEDLFKEHVASIKIYGKIQTSKFLLNVIEAQGIKK